jgi:hypothetical protein
MFKLIFIALNVEILGISPLQAISMLRSMKRQSAENELLGWRRAMLLGLCACLLTGCATRPAAVATATAPTAGSYTWNTQQQMDWQELPFPGKVRTIYRLDDQAPQDNRGQRGALKAEAQSSASMLRTPIRLEADALSRIGFSWLVPALIPDADMALRGRDDSPVRLILAFDGDRSKFSAKDATLNELTRLVTGEEMPYATLMYVWCNQRPVGSVIHNARTDRIRKIVVESGTPGLMKWRNYERDIRADFERVFGEAPGALVAIGLMTDSDNTQSNTVAWYGPVSLH